MELQQAYETVNVHRNGGELRIELNRPTIVIPGVAACVVVLFKVLADKIELVAIVDRFR